MSWPPEYAEPGDGWERAPPDPRLRQPVGGPPWYMASVSPSKSRRWLGWVVVISEAHGPRRGPGSLAGVPLPQEMVSRSAVAAAGNAGVQLLPRGQE